MSLARARALGVVFVVVSALCFGAMAILARAAYASGVDTTTLLALRFALAGVALIALVSIRKVPVPSGGDFARCAALGAIGYGAQAYTFFTALTLAPAGLIALLLYLHPAIVALLAAWLLREPLSRPKMLALGLALTGTLLTVGPVVGGEASVRVEGVALGVASAAIYAVYIVAGTRLAQRVHPLALSAIVVSSAALLYIGLAALQGPHWPIGWSGWLSVVGIAIIATVLAITLYFAGLARIGPTRAATLSTVEPVFTVALAALLLNEQLRAVQLAGGALILIAVAILARTAAADPEPVAMAQR